MKKVIAVVKKNKPKRVLGVLPSAVETNRQDSKAKEYVRHIATIVESSEDAIVSKSLDGIITSWNSGGEKMFGYTAAEAVGSNIAIIIPPEYKAEERAIMERICHNEVIDHYETVRRKKNGELFFVSLTVSPLKDLEGKIIGVSKIARDITSRKLAEAEIMRANTQLVTQQLEKEVKTAELLVANKELIFRNEEKEKRAAELIIANKELAFQNEEKEKRAAELLIANAELLFQNNEKESRAAELIIANKELAFQNDEKEKRAAELIIANKELAFQNEEKEKRAAELLIANAELLFQNHEKEQRAAELKIANHDLAVQEVILKKHNKELEQFAYVASHDLQEPLRTVANYMQIFEEDYLPLLDDKALSYLRLVNRATERMSKLIKSLLEFSRLGNNSKVVRVDCGAMLADVIEDLVGLIKKSNATIKISDMPVLNLYEVEIRQVFQNLITNAIKFQKKDALPVIGIRYWESEGVHNFSVTDNGIGIEPAHFDKIFEIFQRLPTIDKFEGDGIGLANCKKIIQMHEGEVVVQSRLDEGTTIIFTIGNLKLA